MNTLPGIVAADDRGELRFVNDFDFKKAGIRRFYQVENWNTDIVRAFHGHKVEAKYVWVVRGAIRLAVAALLFNRHGFRGVSQDMDRGKVPIVYDLSAANPRILYIPPGYCHGFRMLQKYTIVQFFSTSTLEESLKDDYRLPFDFFASSGFSWEVINR